MAPQPTLEPLRRWDPERIGQYALLGRLGAGAMGQVYLGRSTGGRLVAVKTIKIELAEEAGFRDHFAHEVAAARRVSGMFTAAVVAADPDANVPWLATAYVPAPSLRRLVKSCGPQPVATVWWLAAGCAEALESIHGAGLVHRDLKPSNVLVAPDGPRVIDFGVARAAERIQLTVTHGAVGTPAYMAPEQARDTRQASMASDVFALGATLLYAATGHAPYQGETVMDVLVRLATEPPDLTGLPAELAGLITGCLERSPRDRPTSAALLAELGPLVADPGGLGLAGGDGGHSFLTPQAMSLIGEFQRSPQNGVRGDAGSRAGQGSAGGSDDSASETSSPSLGSEPGFDSEASLGSEPSIGPEPEATDPTGFGDDGATYASYAEILPPDSQPARRWFRRASRQTAGQRGTSGGGTTRPPGRRPPRQHDAVLSLAGRVVAAVLLIGAGALIGSQLRTPAASVSDSSTGTSGAAGLPAFPDPNAPPPTAFPAATARPGRPALVMLQPYGSGKTVFVVHGSGWAPGSLVSIALAGQGAATVRPKVPVDPKGSFNYAIDQGHVFFPGAMPIGIYHVIVTGTGGSRVTSVFRVIPPPPSPPPGSGPPTGPPPTGPPSGPPPSAQPSPSIT